MKLLHLARLLFVFGALTAAAFAADPSGTWKWIVQSPNGEIHTTLKLEAKGGKLTGAYSNQFGEATIKNASLKDDVIAFEVVRNLNGSDFVVKYQGKLEGDTIKGTLEAAVPGGGDTMKLDWNAKRAAKE